MKLAIAQVILGAAISLMGMRVFLLPLGFYFLILGLLVLGCGIAQFVQARRLASAPKSSSRLPQGTLMSEE